jgi:DNA repair photolyase
MNIYEPSGRAREYSPLALNYFKGCDNACLYCYVPNLFVRFNSKYEHGNVISPLEFESLKKSAKKMKDCGKQILLSFTTDPYNNLETTETAQVLDILNFYNHKVAILTKNPSKAIKDIELFKSFGNRFKIGSTLTFDNDIDSIKWEKEANLPKQRIDSLRYFAENGIITWASFEPVIIPEQSLNLLNQSLKFIDHVKIGKINNYKGIDKTIDWSKFIVDSVSLLRENKYDDKFYIKKDLLAFNKGVYLSLNETNEDHLNI